MIRKEIKRIAGCNLFLITLLICLFRFDLAFTQKLPPWVIGELDIYQISTGMGNAAFCIFPDGTTLLIEAGAINEEYPRAIAPIPKPNSSRSAGEWISRFVQEVLPKDKTEIDYALLTHFHDDHMGGPNSTSKNSAQGNYKLAGITEVGSLIPIRKIIDRGWPNYTYPDSINSFMLANYRSFLDWHIKNRGLLVEQFLAGHSDQITLKYQPKKYRGFEVRNVASNGKVWTGKNQSSFSHFPDLTNVLPKDFPTENSCSNVLKISYGNFDYFHGGDIYGIIENGKPHWHDMESIVAAVTGEVDVQVVNHHGYRDAQNETLIRNLRPQVFVVPAWASVHPDPEVLKRILSQELYAGKRDIFITSLLKESAEVNRELLPFIKSTEGHVLIRVERGGKKFKVYILSHDDESLTIKNVFDDYRSR